LKLKIQIKKVVAKKSRKNILPQKLQQKFQKEKIATKLQQN